MADDIANMNGAQLQQHMLDEGVPAGQVSQWRATTNEQMVKSGMAPADIDKYWGVTKPDMSAAVAAFHEGQAGLTPEEGQKIASNPLEQIAAGLQSSTTLLGLKGKPTILPEHAGMLSDLLEGAGQFVGDIPATVAGFVGGGAAGGAVGGPLGYVIGAGAGAAALPAALRQVLMDHYASKDGPFTFRDFWTETMKTLMAGAKGGIAGGIAAPLGGVVGGKALSAGMSAVEAAGTDAVTQAVAATAVGGALEGRIPNAQDGASAAVLALGFHTAGSVVGATRRLVWAQPGEQVAQNARDIYAKTGVNPIDAATRSRSDLAIQTEVLAPQAADGTILTPALDAIAPPEVGHEKGIELPRALDLGQGEVNPQQEDENAPEARASRALTAMGNSEDWVPASMSAEASTALAERGSGGPPGPPIVPGAAPPAGEPPFEMNGKTALDVVGDILAPPAKTAGWLESLNPRQLIAGFQAQLEPLRVIDTALGVGGKDLGIEDMARQTFASKERAGYFVRYGVLDAITLKPTDVGSWMAAYEQVKADGGNVKDFVNYRLALRTLEKAEQGIDTGVNLEAARIAVNDPENRARYQAGAYMIHQAKDGSIDYARDSGLFSPQLADAMKQLNRDHIIFRRVQDPSYRPPVPSRQFGVRQPLRKMEGGEGLIADPITAEVDNLHTIIAMADRNRMVGSIIGAIEEHNGEKPGPPMAALQFAEAMDMDTGRTLDYNVLDENGKPIAPQAAPALAPFLASRTFSSRMGPNDFIYFRNGVPEQWTAETPELAEIMRGQSTIPDGGLHKMASWFARSARLGITAPLDFPLRAITHGQLAAGAFAQEGAMVPFHDVVRGFMHVWNQDDAYQRWVANGGAGTALTDMDVNYIAKDIDALFEDTGTAAMITNTVKHPIQAMRTMQHMVDAAARVGYMTRVENKGYETLKAATMSRTAYLDHAEGRASALVNWWAQTVPFMQIGFKDLEQVGRALQERPFETAMKAGLVLMAPTMINYAANYIADQELPEAEKYSNLPRWERDMYWVLPPVNGARLKIKKPYVGGFLFSTTVERFLDHMVGNDPDAAKDLLTTAYQQTVPPFIPTIITPFVEQFANKSLYNGRPIIQSSVEKQSGYMQYGPDTTGTAKKLAQYIGPPGMNVGNISPATIDNYIRDWGGSLPMTVLKQIDQRYATPSPPQTISDIPFVGSFFARHPGTGSQPIIDFYDRMATYEQAHADLQAATKHRDPQEMQQALDQGDFAHLDGMRTALQGQAAVIAGINRSNMTDQEKQKWTDSLVNNMVAYARVGLHMLDIVSKK